MTCAQIDRGEHVAVEHDDRLAARLAGGKLDPAARAERRRFDHVAQVDAEIAAVAEDFLDPPRLIVQAENDLVDFGDLAQQINLVLQKWTVEDRNDGLRGVERQRPKPRALASGQENRFHSRIEHLIKPGC